jgi:hypothetical protein
VVALVIVLDEGRDLALEVAGQEVFSSRVRFFRD